MRDTDPSDISRDQFSLIEGDLLAATKKTHPREIDMVDSKSVKNTDTACEKGFDAGKKNIRGEIA